MPATFSIVEGSIIVVLYLGVLTTVSIMGRSVMVGLGVGCSPNARGVGGVCVGGYKGLPVPKPMVGCQRWSVTS